MAALRNHQPAALVAFRFPFGNRATEAVMIAPKCECGAGRLAADSVAEGVSTDTVNCAVAGVVAGTLMDSGLGAQVTPGGNAVPAQVTCTTPAVNPEPGAMVMVDALLLPARTDTGVAVTENDPAPAAAAVIFRAMGEEGPAAA